MGLPAGSFPKPVANHSLHVDVKKRYAAGPHSSFQLEVAFTAQPGVTILLGHSGAGKTTLLRSIAGLCRPEKGSIVVGERVLFDSDKGIRIEPARRKVAFVFQDLALFPHLTVYENVSYGLRKMDKTERKRKVNEMMESFQIVKLHKRIPREISGGEQQRVALARSLVTEPSVLLLDEPLSSLDGSTKAGIIDDLRTWNQARRIPILYVTHNHEEVFALGEQVFSLEHGKIIAEGAPIDVLTAPPRQSMVQIAGFENLFDATVIEEKHGMAVCRLAGTSLAIQAPLTRVTPGAPIHVGIKADEILLSASEPKMLSACNVIHGRIRQMKAAGPKVELRIDADVEFRVHLPSGQFKLLNLNDHDDIWLIIRPQSCHLIRMTRMRASQRLFVFICNRNTSRSPMAAAICNAEIARRLRVSHEALNSLGIRAVSAGLCATADDPMATEVQQALQRLRIPAPPHYAQNLTPELATQAEFIFCMTESQRQAVVKGFPKWAPKALCLQPGTDIEDPHGLGTDDFVQLGQNVQQIVRSLVETLVAPAETSESA
jgi:molybdate transport system ATP-binding protein